MMEFYFREDELQELELLGEQSEYTARMAVLIGRRRIGKTSLALEFVKGKNALYLFVAKKSEALLCDGFIEVIKRELDIPIHGKVENFTEIFSILLEYSKEHHLTLIIDEFQEFFTVNPAVFSDIQNLWDLNKKTSKMHVIFIGSVYSMMTRIFENEKEPLFGRADRIFRLRPFEIGQMQSILSDYGVDDLERIFLFYVVTGCVPKYLDILLTNNCTSLSKILNFMLKENSPFIHEGRFQLIEEFGKDYATYFSILELIARGKTSSSEIESVIQKNVSAYLDRLESDYHVIQKFKPVDAKPNSRLQKYQIIDNFLKFWFRFFHRNRDAIELHNYDFIKAMIRKEYNTYAGIILERFFMELIASTGLYNRMGAYWERGGKNEIDIVAFNDLDKTMLVAEVKMNERRNSLVRLEHRAIKLIEKYPDYHVVCKTLSLENAKEYLD